MTTDRSEAALPPIERWWAYLTTASRHQILEDLDAALSEPVCAEIARITGESVPEAVRLGDEEQQFIRHQTEIVD